MTTYLVTWNPTRGKPEREGYPTPEAASAGAIAMAKRHKVRTFAGEMFWDAEVIQRGADLDAVSPRGTMSVRRA